MLREVEIRQFPSSKQASSLTNSEVHLFPLPVLLHTRLSSGRKIDPICGTMGRIDGQEMDSLYRVQDSIQVTFLLSAVPINLIQSTPPPPHPPLPPPSRCYCEKRSQNFSRNRQWKGYGIRELSVFTPGYPGTLGFYSRILLVLAFISAK